MVCESSGGATATRAWHRWPQPQLDPTCGSTFKVARVHGCSAEQMRTASRQRFTARSHSSITRVVRQRSACAHARSRHSSAGSTTVATAGLARCVARGGDEMTTGKATRDVVRAYGGRCTNARRRTPSAVTTHTRPASPR